MNDAKYIGMDVHQATPRYESVDCDPRKNAWLKAGKPQRP